MKPRDEDLEASGTVPSAGMVPTPRTGASAPAVLERGTMAGRYVVLGLEGHGAMGEVYAAFDPQLNRKIALKLIRGEAGGAITDTDGRRRLMREAQAIARLSHANIVVVHDTGTIDGRVFIAMEFVEGQPLVKWMRDARRPWREVLDVFLAAGRGLAHAHAHSIVHRDFKPHNVMLGRDGTVRVMDFGVASDLSIDEPSGVGPMVPLAAALEGGSDDAAAMTSTGMLVGTPAYMAPEQFRAERADARSDQFSFCVALYEGLYGERPFEGRDLQSIARNVVAGRIREAPARSGVPARVRRALLRGLRTQREQRFPSMVELLAELARNPERQRLRLVAGAVAAVALVAAGAGVQRAAQRPATFCRRAGEQLAGVWELPGGGATPRRDAIAAAFTASGLPSAGETWGRVSAGLDAYAREWVRARTDSCEATHVRGEASPEVLDLRTTCLTGGFQRMRALTDVFRTADRAVVGEAVSAVNALPDLARCADLKALRAVTPPPRDPAMRAKVDALERRIADVGALRDAGKLDAALPLARALSKDARALGHDPISARALELECWLEDKTGRMDRAAPLCEEALWAAEAARDDEVAATVAIQLVAETASSKARREDTQRWAHLAAAILKRMGPGHGKLEGWLANNEATVAFYMGEPAKARADYERSIALKTAAEGPDHPDVGISLNNYGNTLADLGDREAAITQLRRAAAIFEHAFGPRNRMMAMPLSNQGEALNALGRPREALPLFQRAIAIIEAEMEPSSSWLAFPLTGVGLSQLALGRAAEAVAPLERAVAIRDRAEAYPLPRGETRFALARAVWESGGDRTRARALAASARAEYERADGATKQVAEIDAWLRARGG